MLICKDNKLIGLLKRTPDTLAAGIFDNLTGKEQWTLADHQLNVKTKKLVSESLIF